MGILSSIFGKKNKQDSNLVIWLEHDQDVIVQLEVKNYKGGEISIGRDLDCTWSLHDIDKKASNTHAIISKRKDGALWITDNSSKNGLWCNGQRIQEKPLVSGDEYLIGESLLIVQEKQNDTNVAWLKSQSTGKTYELTKSLTRLGSGKEEGQKCDITLEGEGISSLHAMITRREGDFCIRDCSKNGTFINDEDIGKQDYPLKDGDRISIMAQELTFLTKLHPEPIVQIEKIALWLITTVIAMLAVYILLRTGGTSPEQHYKQGLGHMDHGEYEQAVTRFNKALVGCDDSRDELRHDIQQCLAKIKRLTQTRDAWEKVKKTLAETKDIENFKEATDLLSSLNKTGDWSWQPDKQGEKERKKAIIVKSLLDAISSANTVLGEDSATINSIQSSKTHLENAQKDAASYLSEPYMGNVNGFVADPLEKLKKTETDYTNLNNVLTKLHNVNDKDEAKNKLAAMLAELTKKTPEERGKLTKALQENAIEWEAQIVFYKEISGTLDDLAKNSLGAIRKQAANLKPYIDSLDKQTVRASFLEEWASSLKFNDIQNFTLDFYRKDDWGYVNELRDALKQYVDNIQQESKRFSDIYGELYSNLHKQRIMDDLSAFENDDLMASVYSFDSLNFPYPSVNRITPCGKYDEMLGIEYFYDYLNEGDRNSLRESVTNSKLRPRIYTLYNGLKAIESGLNSLQRGFNGITWANKGDAENFKNECKNLLAKRKAIIDRQMARDDKRNSREFLVSRGIALYLSSDSDPASMALKAELLSSFKSYKRNLIVMKEEKYDPAAPEEQIRLRKEMLKIGLPGHKFIKDMWIEEHGAQPKQKRQD